MKQLLFSPLFVLIQFVIIFKNGHAQDKELPEFKAIIVAQKRMPALDTQFKAYKTFQFPVNQLAHFVKGKSKTEFRLNLGEDMVWDIVLEHSGIVSKDYKLKLLTSQGLQTVSSQPNYLYKGKVLGVQDGNVILTIKNDLLQGSIRLQDKEFFIEPMRLYNTNSKQTEYLIYDTKDANIQTTARCGTTDSLQSSSNNTNEMRGGGIVGPLSETCLKIPIVLMADYGIYKKFNYDINALETFMLDNMNQVQGFYNGFNFETTSSVDTGQDRLEFQVMQTIISTCNTCDVLENSNYGSTLIKQLNAWLLKSPLYPSYYITNFWTSRNLYSTGSIFGIAGGGNRTSDPTAYCSKYGGNILSHSNENAAILRQLTAHEMGHNMGCQHDNEIKPGVNKFVMNAGPSNPTRFSRLSDFGGVYYSSNLEIKQFSRDYYSCLADCNVSSCEAPSNLGVSFFNHPDSAKFSWTGTGKFKIDVYSADSLAMQKEASHEVHTNDFILTDLSVCKKYLVRILKDCTNGDTSRFASLQFYTNAYQINDVRTELLGKNYDLVVQLKSVWPEQSPIVFIDNKQVESSYDRDNGVIRVKSLLADGNNHKLEFKTQDPTQSCYQKIYYKASDFRSQLQNLLQVNFDSCQMAADWKDSVIRRVVPGKQDIFWQYNVFNLPNVTVSSGTFDSTCYLSYNSIQFDVSKYAKGGRSITSPAMDISEYQNTFVSFDYNFIAYSSPNFYLNKPYFKAEVYNGSQWVTIFERINDKPVHPSLFFINTWDSLPVRVLLPVDQYKNKDFRIRFSFDDGTQYYESSGTYMPFHFFIALDNIRLDGEKVGVSTNNAYYLLYPNPAKDEINIKLSLSLGSDLLYSIHDISGRLVQKGKLNSTKIKTKHFASGLYILQLYKDNKIIGKPHKFIKI